MEFLHKKFNKVNLEDEESLATAITEAFPYLPAGERDAMMEVAFSEGIPDDADIIEAVLRPLIKHQKDQTLKNANISVLVDNDFFEAVKNEDNIASWRERSHIFPCQRIVGLTDSQCLGIRRTRVLNIGLANEMNNIHYHKPLISTNPCGEIWLEAYGCCDLGAINLAQHINEDGTDFDWDALNDTVNLGIRFLDDVLDVNTYLG